MCVKLVGVFQQSRQDLIEPAGFTGPIVLVNHTLHSGVPTTLAQLEHRHQLACITVSVTEHCLQL